MSTLSESGPPPAAADPPPSGPAAGPTNPPGPADRRAGSGLFRAFWRWHFYASVLVVPILLMLSLTGLVYLFRWQLDAATHPGLLTVDVPAHGAPLALSVQERAVTAAHAGHPVTAVQEGAENRATFFTVSLGGGESRNVYVDPYTGRILGTLDPDDLLSNIAAEIHGKLVFGSLSEVRLFHDPVVGKDFLVGSIGDRVIELAACWAVVMALTGYYLFVRGRTARLRRVAAGARAAGLRHRHGLVGALLGGGLLLLVVSGLPWTGVWGAKVQQLASGHGLSLWGEDPGARSTLGARLERVGSSSAPAPWAEGAAPLPSSSGGPSGDGHAGHGPAGTRDGADQESVGIDRVVAAARADGLAGPYYVTYPEAPDGVFSVLSDQWHDKANPAFSDVTRERTVHVDRYSGAVVGRYGYPDYSAAAKVVTQGIALHEGRRFGSFNLVATTAFCLGVVFLCVSGPLMWWKRRPRSGGMAAPRGRLPLRATPALVAGVVLLGAFLPLFGASLLLVLAADQLVIRRVPALARRLGSG